MSVTRAAIGSAGSHHFCLDWANDVLRHGLTNIGVLGGGGGLRWAHAGKRTSATPTNAACTARVQSAY